MADYDMARRVVENLAEELYTLGYEVPLRIVEGNNAIGDAVRDCRDTRCIRIVRNAMRNWAQEVMSEPDSPQKRAAIQHLKDADEEFKESLLEGLDDPRPQHLAPRR